MCVVSVLIPLALVLQVYAQELASHDTGVAQDSMEKLVDNLVDNVVNKLTNKLASQKLSETDSMDKSVDYLLKNVVDKLISRAIHRMTHSQQQMTRGTPTRMTRGTPSQHLRRNVIAFGAGLPPGNPSVDFDTPKTPPRPPSGSSFLSRAGNSASYQALDITQSLASTLVLRPKEVIEGDKDRVKASVQKMQTNAASLDVQSGAQRLSLLKVGALFGSAVASGAAPYLLAERIVHTFVPALAGLIFSIGCNAEYTGKVAVARGKEVSATTVKVAAEAEIYLARAERVKAIIGLCVGISATAAAYALIIPALIEDLEEVGVAEGLLNDTYLIMPLIAGLAAAVAALASTESKDLSQISIATGERRFARVTRESVLQSVEKATGLTKEKWFSFALGVLPAPLLATICPGDLGFKAVVAAAGAAAQCTYSLVTAEYILAAAVESVSLKSRTAALSETYSNQASKASSILPFTSALSGACLATAVVAVEVCPALGLTFGHGALGVFSEAVMCGFFPVAGAIFAAASYISSTCATIDADAATEAADKIPDSRAVLGSDKDPTSETLELLGLTIKVARRRTLNWINGVAGQVEQSTRNELDSSTSVGVRPRT